METDMLEVSAAPEAPHAPVVPDATVASGAFAGLDGAPARRPVPRGLVPPPAPLSTAPSCRRRLLGRGAALALAAFFGRAPEALAAVDELEAAIAELGGDAATGEGGALALDIPPIAENGFGVPIAFDVASPMTAADHVETVIVVAPENPEPRVATFRFTPRSGVAKASTRIRLARSQRVHVLARTSAGAFHRASARVEVTIGGCGA